MKYHSLEKMNFRDTLIQDRLYRKWTSSSSNSHYVCFFLAGRITAEIQWNKNFKTTCWRLRWKCLPACLILSRMNRERNPPLSDWMFYLWNKTDDYEWDDYFMHRFILGFYQAGYKKVYDNDDDSFCNNKNVRTYDI